LSVKIPSDFSLREGERPIWHGRRSFKSVIGYIIVGLVPLFFRAASPPLEGWPLASGSC